ncbi:MAG: ATP-dependent Clp protease adaptor ClpS [Planctomycetes bacterium]|nr:ATP-dependent Clp protease adaptor ClpS [Planctomycetota bacterium]
MSNEEAFDSRERSVTTLVAPAKRPTSVERRPKRLPPYRVLLHNDDVNTFEHVIKSVLQLTTLEVEEAVIRALEAHETGVALLLVTHQERAELYVEQFASLSIIVTIEPTE